ncbi:hypothetical protein ACGLHS_17870 [Variovorax sp. VaC1]|uniref:hypothetical protein n=1 Tax=Variovorax sp. VaC1 TaxID=3373132 RepID=UPI003748D4B1
MDLSTADADADADADAEVEVEARATTPPPPPAVGNCDAERSEGPCGIEAPLAAPRSGVFRGSGLAAV